LANQKSLALAERAARKVAAIRRIGILRRIKLAPRSNLRKAHKLKPTLLSSNSEFETESTLEIFYGQWNVGGRTGVESAARLLEKADQEIGVPGGGDAR
jgi:hypothetical protein